MKLPAAPPFLMPPESVVEAQPWQLPDGAAVDDRLEHWDVFTDLDLSRSVEVDVDGVRSACQLSGDATLAIGASWKSSTTRLSGSGELMELGDLGGRVRTAVTLRVPAADIGGRLDLSLRLVLRSPGATSVPIAPRRRGTILWTDEHRVYVEGDAARFPVTAADFSTLTGVADDAAWALDWDPDDLEAPLLGGLRLLVNSANELVLASVRSGSSDPRSQLLRQFVYFDVARMLVTAALSSDQFVEAPDSFEEGTVGRMLSELIAGAWPTSPVGTLRQRLLTNPTALAADMQARFKVLG